MNVGLAAVGNHDKFHKKDSRSMQKPYQYLTHHCVSFPFAPPGQRNRRRAMPVQVAFVLALFLRLGRSAALPEGGCDILDGESNAAFAAVQLGASLKRRAPGLLWPSCALATPELPAAIRGFLGRIGQNFDTGFEADAALAKAAKGAGCNLALWHKLVAPSTGKQAAALVSLVESLQHLRLMPSRREAGSGTTTYVFESFDENGKVGTGMLGQGCQEKSVSEVTITVPQDGPFLWANLTAPSMPFRIGPPCAKTHLISGTMWTLKATPEGLAGGIRAGFVNLRSTMSGTWSTGREGFHGNLTVAFQELLEVEWTWSPEEG